MLHALPDHPSIARTLDEVSEGLGENVLELDSPEALRSTVSVRLALLACGVAVARALIAEGLEPEAPIPCPKARMVSFPTSASHTWLGVLLLLMFRSRSTQDLSQLPSSLFRALPREWASLDARSIGVPKRSRYESLYYERYSCYR